MAALPYPAYPFQYVTKNSKPDKRSAIGLFGVEAVTFEP